MKAFMHALACGAASALLLSFAAAQGQDQKERSVEASREAAPAAALPLCFSHTRFNISTMIGGKVRVLTDSNKDFKPVSNMDGKTLVFFRVQTYGDGSFETWRTAIYVVNVDGSGLRQLTSGEFADYNPTFLRDDTNRIAFSRYNRTGKRHSEIFLTTPTSEIGSEQRVSHPTIPAYEYVYSSLKDGRLLIHRIETAEREVYLLTPAPGELGKYERVQMPTNNYVHKLCISPSETKITYMFDNDNNGATYNDVQIAWARFDAKALKVWDQKLITPDDRATIDEYPKWSPDETCVLYDSDKADPGKGVMQIYSHRIADDTEQIVSLNPKENDQFPCVLGYPH
jgi:Tol biopolymer transport system component